MNRRCHAGPSRCRPWANIYNGVLTVESIHGGHRHTNAVSLTVLMRLLKGSIFATTEEELTGFLNAMHLPLIRAVPHEGNLVVARGGPHASNV